MLAFIPSWVLAISCQFTLFLIRASFLFSHKLKNAEMLTVAVRPAGGLLVYGRGRGSDSC